ncbi:MAG TPA: class I SAM-dependent methyltransferase [Candidatus Limnocylindria bacterium]|nr:class I SAM-dependent methyltransferase [Candidatus Limnocylindria bacterium]
MADDQREFWEGGGVYRRSDHPVVELFARQRVRYLDDAGLLAGVRSLLDVGAGNGFSSRYYAPDVHVVACDYAAGMLDGNPVRDRVRASASALPFPDEAFDVVACWELLHHLDDPVAAVREMHRVARRRVVMFEPNRINPGHIVLGLTRSNERQSLRFSPGHVRRLVRAADLRVARQERCGLLFPNITPTPIARLLVRLPYRMPVIGISQLVVIEKAPSDAPPMSPPGARARSR